MQLDSCPLRAADITPDLQKKFAFLSGQIAMSFFVFLFVLSVCFTGSGFFVILFAIFQWSALLLNFS